MQRSLFATHPARLAAAALAVLAGVTSSACSDNPKTNEDDSHTNVDGGCTAGAILSCPEEKGAVAEVCDPSGTTSSLVACNDLKPADAVAGDDYVCFQNECVVDVPGCLTGEVKSCTVEGGREALMCNASHTGFQPQLCKGPDGDASQCKDKACTYCFPGARKCQDDKTVVACNADGTGFEVIENCVATSDDTVCTGNQCEKLCDLNFKNNSYIGCEYFAADLDNAFVPGGNDGFFDAAGAQFAVVVANPPN